MTLRLCVPPLLVSVVLEWNSGLMQLDELCPEW